MFSFGSVLENDIFYCKVLRMVSTFPRICCSSRNRHCRGVSVSEIERMEWHFLRVVDERTNATNSYENQSVCSVR